MTNVGVNLTLNTAQLLSEFNSTVDRMRTKALQAAQLPSVFLPRVNIPAPPPVSAQGFARQAGFQAGGLQRQISLAEHGPGATGAQFGATGRQIRGPLQNQVTDAVRAAGGSDADIALAKKDFETGRLSAAKVTRGKQTQAEIQEALNAESLKQFGVEKELTAATTANVAATKSTANRRLSNVQRQDRDLRQENETLRRGAGVDPRAAVPINAKALTEENNRLIGQAAANRKSTVASSQREALAAAKAANAQEAAAAAPRRRALSGSEREQSRLLARNQGLRETAGSRQFIGPRTAPALNAENEALVREASNLRKLNNAALRTQVGSTQTVSASVQAEVAVQRQINAAKRKNLELESTQQPQLIQARAQTVILQNQQNQQLRRAIQLEARRQGLSIGQRAQLTAQGGGRGGQSGFLAGGLASTLRFAIPAAALFGTIGAVGKLIENGKELELVFNRIDAQFNQLGANAEFGDQFDNEALANFKEGIIDISRETGVSAAVVGDLAESFVGLFVDQGPETGLQLTALAVQLAVITDLEPAEAFNDLGAALRAFVDEGDDVVQIATEISDTVIAVRNATGIAGDELTDFVSRVAALGVEAGGSIQQLTALGAAIQQASGVGGAALAEQFGRILSGFSSGVGVEIFELSKSIGGLDISAADVNGGQAIPVLLALISQYEDLNDAQRTQIRTQLAGRREGATLTALLNNSATALRVLNDELVQGGEAQTEFNRRQQTLSQQMKLLGTTFQELGITLFEAGLSDLLISFVNALDALVTIADATVIPVLEVLADLLGQLPDGFGAAALGATGLALALRGTGVVAAGGLIGQETAVAGTATLSQRVAAGQTARGPDPSGLAFAGRLRDPQGGRLGGRNTLSSTGRIGGSRIAQVGSVVAAALAVGKLFEVLGDLSVQVEQDSTALRAKLASATEETILLALETGSSITEDRGFLERFANNVGIETGDPQAIAQEAFANFASRQGQQLIADIGAASDEALEIFFDQAQGAGLTGLERTINAPGANRGFAADAGLLGQDATTSFNAFDFSPVEVDISNLTQDNLDLLTEGLTGSLGLEAQRIATTFFASIGEIPDALAEETDPVVRRALAEAAQLLAETEDAAVFDLDLIRAQFDTGQIGLPQLVEGLRRQLATTKEIAFAGEGNSEELAKALKLQQEIQDIASDSLTAQFESFERTLSFGTDQEAISPEAQIGRLETLITDLRAVGDEAGAAEAADEIFTLQQEILNTLGDEAGSSQEAIAIANQGLAANPIALSADIRGELENQQSAFTQFLDAWLGAGIDLTDAMKDDLTEKIIETGNTQVALAQILADRASDLQAEVLQAATRGRIVTDQVAELAEIRSRQLDGIQSTDIPGLAFNRRIGDAAAAKARAEAQAKEAENLAKAISDARFDLLQALFGGDPVRSAQIAQDQAAAQFRLASDEAERIKAQAAIVRADRSLEEAIRDITDAQVELALAFADYAGNAIEATEISLESARDRLSNVQKDFEGGQAGQADVLRAEADVVRAEAAARDEQLNSQLGDFQFLFDMEQITKTQFISYLQSLKQIPDLTTEQIRDIDRQIKQLRDDVQQDLQFNLPTNFRLPTLFEARRVDQGTGGGAGFQDNRQVSVTMVINNGMSQQAAADFLFDAIGGGPTTTTNRRF